MKNTNLISVPVYNFYPACCEGSISSCSVQLNSLIKKENVKVEAHTELESGSVWTSLSAVLNWLTNWCQEPNGNHLGAKTRVSTTASEPSWRTNCWRTLLFKPQWEETSSKSEVSAVVGATITTSTVSDQNRSVPIRHYFLWSHITPLWFGAPSSIWPPSRLNQLLTNGPSQPALSGPLRYWETRPPPSNTEGRRWMRSVWTQKDEEIKIYRV